MATAQEPQKTGNTQEIELRLLHTSPAATSADASALGIEPRVLSGRKCAGAYENVYPGIASAGYRERHHFEYVFRLDTGADPELIELKLEGFRVVDMSAQQDIVLEGSGIDAYQQHPIAYRRRKSTETEITVDYEVRGDNAVGIAVRDPLRTQQTQLNGHKMNVVPAGGQAGGPEHTFYLSKCEVTSTQFMRFLNDAQAAPNDARGINLFFDAKGNVWFNRAMRRNRHEVFRVSQSRLAYDPSRPLGRRYRHAFGEGGSTPFAGHPITGISWVGALKYCNWLTIYSGRGEAEQCYSEGTNIIDWGPVTATNWAKGRFSEAERKLLLKRKGFRLPMLHCDPSAIHTNTYNEFYKAAAWNTVTNLPYAFGRKKAMGIDANSIDTLNRHSMETMPVGFFNGANNLDEIRTMRNENAYGLHDLSGNVSEWMTDFGRSDSTATRALCGGSWAHRLKAVTVGEIASPVATSSFAGFRVGTTYMPEDFVYVHLAYCFHMLTEPVLDVARPDGGTREDLELAREPAEGLERSGVFVDEETALSAAEETPGVVYTTRFEPEPEPEPVAVESTAPGVLSIPEASPGGGDDDDDDDDDSGV